MASSPTSSMLRQNPSDCLTKTALTRLGVIARLMMRTLFTPLGTPYASRAAPVL